MEDGGAGSDASQESALGVLTRTLGCTERRQTTRGLERAGWFWKYALGCPPTNELVCAEKATSRGRGQGGNR